MYQHKKRHLSGGSLGPFCTFHAKNVQVVFVLEILAALGALKRIGESSARWCGAKVMIRECFQSRQFRGLELGS